ncbi:MAG: DoxX family membrane protein [Anaerolineae bacterium]|nr:DoxX family membrane protein [Anaerolineae bacterium]
MQENNETVSLRKAGALLRITLGVILVVGWYDNLSKGIYTAEGLQGLFNWIFNEVGGGSDFYRSLINATILQVPGLFSSFMLVAELLLGLGLLFGVLTPLAAVGAGLFFANLFFAFYGGSEWIWTYVILTVSAIVVTWMRAGREWGIDRFLLDRRGEPPVRILW